VKAESLHVVLFAFLGRGLPASSRRSARASPSPSCPPGVSSHPSGRTPLIRLHVRPQREWGSTWAHACQGIDRTRRGPARSMGEQRLGSRVSWGGGQNRWQGIDRTAAWPCSLDDRRKRKRKALTRVFRVRIDFFDVRKILPGFLTYHGFMTITTLSHIISRER
jgi:hypothetical protein